MIFQGFETPQQNWSKLPHTIIDSLPDFSTLAELKVVLYVLRHTWGYGEFSAPKPITIDEFENGRKRADGTRMDGGVGMLAQAIRKGLKRAVEAGFLTVSVDDADKGNVIKSYALHMRDTQADSAPEIVEIEGGDYHQGDDNHPPVPSWGGVKVTHSPSKERNKDTSVGDREKPATAKGDGRKRRAAIENNGAEPTAEYEDYWREWTQRGLNTTQLAKLSKSSPEVVLKAMKRVRKKPDIDMPFNYIVAMLDGGFAITPESALPDLPLSDDVNEWAKDIEGVT